MTDEPTTPADTPLQPSPDPQADATAPTEPPDAPQPAPPEPMTPQRAEAENRRNDVFIMLAAAIVACLLGIFKINDPELWLHLKAGWQIEHEGVPKQDSFTFSRAGQPWVNSNWLFDWAIYQAELIETRSRVRRLAVEYQKLLAKHQEPQLDDQGRDVGTPFDEPTRQRLEDSFAKLARTADTSDTYQMRLAAESVAAEVESSGLAIPQAADRGTYPALAEYGGVGGPALIRLYVPIAIKALLLVVLAGVLIFVRQPGPTRWWAATLSVIALVAMGDRLTFSPEVLSLLLLAATFWTVHAFDSGRTWAAWLLVPLEMLWANVDSLFPLGLVVAGLYLIGEAIQSLAGRRQGDATGPGWITMLMALAVAALGTLANPYGLGIWSVPLEWTREMVSRTPYVAASLLELLGSDAEWIAAARAQGGQILSIASDLFSPLSRTFVGQVAGLAIPPLVTTLLVVAALGSFLFYRARFRLSRLLILLWFIATFCLAVRYEAIVALAAAVVLSLNAQEWYLHRFGSETRITRGWLIWSQGGRGVTILALAAVAFAAITGRLRAANDSEFGFGIQWMHFDFGAARFLRQAPLQGHALNTVPLHGNLIIWANYPANKVFVDSRVLLHRDGIAEADSLKVAMRDQNDAETQKILDKYGVSAVVLNITALADRITFLRTYQTLRTSKDWKLVHRDSSNAVFGRAALPAEHPLAADAQWIQANGLDANRMVYRENAPRLPDPPAPVTPPTFIDRIWKTRRTMSTETILANHYLNPQFDEYDPEQRVFVVAPENCFMAIRHARRGLAMQQRVSPYGYMVLSRAYFYLYNMEMAVAPNPEINELRYLELLSALNQLVAANPENLEAQLQLGFLYANVQFLDLADRHFEAAIRLIPEDATIENFMMLGGQLQSFSKTDLIRMSDNLKVEIDRVRFDLEQLSAQNPSPVARANYLLQRGCPGLAIEQLTESAAFAPAGVDLSPTLAHLFIRVGQAGDPFQGAEREMQNMQGTGGMPPGAKKEMWSTIKLMQGDYHAAKMFLEDAIAETRHGMAQAAMLGLTDQLRDGSLLAMAFAPTSSIEDADRRATLEFQLAMLQLEAGEPREAERHFKTALEIREDIPFRPLIGFYLEKITGEKLPDLPPRPTDDDIPAAESKPADAKPAETGPPADTKPDENKPAETKVDDKPATKKGDAPKPATKPDDRN